VRGLYCRYRDIGYEAGDISLHGIGRARRALADE
jgi:hypothetical protein